MKTTLKYFFYALTMSVFIGCSSDDNDENPTPGTGTKERFVLMTSTEKLQGAGYFTALDSLPKGTISNTNSKTLQLSDAFGFRTFGKWFFNRANPAGDVGLQKYSVNADGSFKDEGFIAGSTQYLVVNETTGYYLDETRGTLKLQKFNPTTMLRTGEVDISAVSKTGVAYQVVGKHTIAAKEGKLFVGVTYGTTESAGYGDDLYNTVYFAVIDIATDKYEKTITYDGLRSIGWGSSGNKMWSIGDDGAIYLYSSGLGNSQFANPSIIRIKKGETDFDKTFIFSTKDIQKGNSLVTALVKDGKLYYEMASTPLLTDYSNLTNTIFDYYIYDMTTKQSTKITGVPLHDYAYGNEQAITEIDGKIYLWVKNEAQKIDGYYVLNGTSATQVFNLGSSGNIQGFAKLTE